MKPTPTFAAAAPPVHPPRRALAVLVVDERPLLREALACLLSRGEGAGMAARGAGLEETLERPADAPVDVIVTADDPDALSRLRGALPGVPVLVVGSDASIAHGFAVVRSGAGGYLLTSDSPADLRAAVRLVRRGRRTVSRRLASEAPGPVDVPDGTPRLSPREAQLMRMIVGGTTMRAASRALGISESTASTYRQRVLRKLDLRTTAHLIRYAVEHGLVD